MRSTVRAAVTCVHALILCSCWLVTSVRSESLATPPLTVAGSSSDLYESIIASEAPPPSATTDHDDDHKSVKSEDDRLQRRRRRIRLKTATHRRRGERSISEQEAREEGEEFSALSRATNVDVEVEEVERLLVDVELLGFGGSNSYDLSTVESVDDVPTETPSAQITTAPPTSTPTQTTTGVPTHSPTEVVVDSCQDPARRSEIILGRLANATNDAALEDPSSPQNEAAEWLVDDDPMQAGACDPALLQRYALAVVYFGMNGEGWERNDGWLSGLDECEWQNVVCDDPGGDSDADLPGAGGAVITLDLQNNNLAGTIVPEISLIASLLRLRMFNNTVIGTIPTEVASSLTNLADLDLERNRLSGTLPNEMFDNLTSLRDLRVSFNMLEGSVSYRVGELTNLRSLWLAENNLSSVIPSSIGRLHDLETFLAYSNSLSGSLPAAIGELNKLQWIDVSDNDFTGSIPESVYGYGDEGPSGVGLPLLRRLLLDSNALTGSISPRIGRLTSLEFLNLQDNLFTGSMPDISNLVALEQVSLRGNDLSGTISNDIANLERLTYLDLTDNSVGGTLPEGLFANLQSLQFLYFSGNVLTGSIPPTLGGLVGARDIYLDGNGLIGTVPPIEPGQLEGLEEFLLNSNSIVGSMPESICALREGGKLSALWADCDEVECACCTNCQ